MKALKILMVTGFLWCGHVASAQPDQPEQPALRGIQQSLERIVDLLEAQNSTQRVALLLERLKIESDALVRLEASLRTVRTEEHELRARVVTLAGSIDEWEDRILDDTDASYEETQARIRTELGQSKAELERLSTVLEARSQTGDELDRRLTAQRIDYDRVKTVVDELLELDS